MIYVVAYNRAQAGYWILDDYVQVRTDTRLNELRDAIEVALGRSKDGVPNPERFAGLVTPLLAAAGVRSWAAFARRTKLVFVSQVGNVVEVTPYRRADSRGDFEAITDCDMELTPGDPALGATVVELLEKAGVGSRLSLELSRRRAAREASPSTGG